MISNASPRPDSPEVINTENITANDVEGHEANDKQAQEDRNAQRVVAGGALVALTVAGAFIAGVFTGDRGGDSSSPVEAGEQPGDLLADDLSPELQEDSTSETEGSDRGVTFYDPTESNGDEETLDTDAEMVVPEYEPVIQDGSTPDILLNQYKNNIECLANASSMDTQNQCARHLVGDVEGDLTNHFYDMALDFHNYREQTGLDYYQQFISFDVLDSDISGDEVIPESLSTLRFIIYEAYDNGSEETFHLIFKRATHRTMSSLASELDINIEENPVWVLDSKRPSEDLFLDEIVTQ